MIYPNAPLRTLTERKAIQMMHEHLKLQENTYRLVIPNGQEVYPAIAQYHEDGSPMSIMFIHDYPHCTLDSKDFCQSFWYILYFKSADVIEAIEQGSSSIPCVSHPLLHSRPHFE